LTGEHQKELEGLTHELNKLSDQVTSYKNQIKNYEDKNEDYETKIKVINEVCIICSILCNF